MRLNREGLPAMSDEEEIMKEPEITLTLHTQDELEYKDELLDYIRRKNLARARRKMLEEEAEELKVKRELEKLQHGENGNFTTDGGQNLSAAPLLITALAPTKEEREALLKELSENKELALSLGLMLNAPRSSTMPFFPFFAPPMQQQQQTAVTDLAEALEKLAKIAREERGNDRVEELREELRELREALTKRDPVEDIKKLLEIRRELQELQGEEKGKREEVELLSKAVKEMGESVNKAISSLRATILRLEQERGGGSQEREIERAKRVMQNLKEYVDAAKELTNILSSSSSGDGEDYYKRKKFEHELELERLEKEKELERERRKRERDMAIARLLEMMRSKHREGDEGEEEEEENEEDRFEIGSVEEEGEKGIEIEIGEEEEEEERKEGERGGE
ncbi:MAG: hypothetical protein ACXQTM_07790 [Methanosarcinales archaeon]